MKPSVTIGRSVRRVVQVTPPVGSPYYWDFDVQGDLAIENLTTTASSYTLTALGTFTIGANLWGQGTETAAGPWGGYQAGEILVAEGDVFILTLARGGGLPGGAQSGRTGKKGGGFTGLFRNSISLANAVLIAAGAGGKGHDGISTPIAHGGGLVGNNGDSNDPPTGGTQSAGGAGSNNSEGPASAGVALAGGQGGTADNGNPSFDPLTWGPGGGGGGGKYGGGGGGGGGSDAGSGAGGSSFAASEVINPFTETGGGRSNPRRGSGGDEYVGRAVLF